MVDGMTPDLESLYEAAKAANERVTTTGAAYAAATRARGAAYLALKASGQSLYAMAKKLGLSTARVSQIVTNAEKAADKEVPGE